MSPIISLSACLIAASHANHISPELLVSVIAVEGGASGLSSKNKNDTEDLGIMQINTGAWLKLVSDSFFDGNSEKAYMKLRDDGCFNIYIGAWILGRSIRMEGGDIWQGVGRYHSITYRHKQKYIRIVNEKYKSIFQ
ncbi:TPA: lytic transglycosylase domain-containing protein [Escherichia coli]|uniref:lytic transglycosylase domain-containing protein n=1 Tax=Escherichia coli TaxID=562 RepID=UPI000B42CAE0|nr:lytic transglycosylase domain-containing protein [Escherichia coli]OWC45057.1 lytic transglycosylase [Escherichia coli]RCP60559.1 lytic transglycosylase [Escherichia coli]HAH2772563.1 lytic transglycosylase [Escherichia coli]HAM4608292.1 lytic transglycosylase domain-containing protein [Escherichia coli]HBA7003916.1 lytic transglycosylase domain-containing protein [Escherichia coli]